MTTTIETPIQIAFLDDHVLFRQGVIHLLKQLPYVESVVEAGSLPELKAALLLRQPDVLLLDLQMPDTDGMEAAKELLQLYPELKIIVLSMHSAEHFIFHMMKLGARSYLPKDVDQAQLREAIEAVFTNGYYFNDAINRAMLRGMQRSSRTKPALQTAERIPLTPREREILTLICKGCTAGEIAGQLFISVRTVEGHRQNLLDKTNTHNSVSLAVYAIEHGMVEIRPGR